MKKVLVVLFSILMMISLVGCDSSQEKTKDSGSTDSKDELNSTVTEEYAPTKDISFVVPYAAGGNSDIPARIFAKYMTKYSAKEVKVVNITGSGGRVGAVEVMNSDNDGSMLLMQPVGYPMQYSLGIANFTYEDFEPVGEWLDSALALVVNSNSQYKTLDDLVNAAKENPETIKMGSVTGTLPLFATIEIENQKDIQFKKVDLSETSKAPELLGNRIDAYIDGFGAVKQYIDSDQFRCLGIISDVDVNGYEDLSNFEELGFENYKYLKQTFGIWAPKDTPNEIVDYMNSLIKKAANDEECIKELNELAYRPTYSTAEDYTNTLKETYKAFEEAATAIIN